jgi:hypothetical protein
VVNIRRRHNETSSSSSLSSSPHQSIGQVQMTGGEGPLAEFQIAGGGGVGQQQPAETRQTILHISAL